VDSGQCNVVASTGGMSRLSPTPDDAVNSIGHRDTLRVALVCPNDPTDPDVNSGAPAALLQALAELCDPVPVTGLPGNVGRGALHAAAAAGMRPRDLRDPQTALGSSRSKAEFGRLGIWLRSRRIAGQLATADRIDGCVQFGTQFSLPKHTRRVTLDDTTVVQARASYGWPDLEDNGNARRWQIRQRQAYRQAQACCAMSHWAARSIVEDYDIPALRVHVVGLGRNHDVLPPLTRDWSVPRFLFIGKDWDRKNGDGLVQAFNELRATVPAARLDIVGEHPQLDEPGITCHGLLALSNPDHKRLVAELLQTSTCLVMPSWHEPTGTVHAEASAAGLPSIGTSIGGVDTVIGDGGLIVDPNTPADLIAAMLKLAHPATAQRLGALAQARSGLFTWSQVAERLVRALAPPGYDLSGLAAFL
jgi:glycosyltransferase involved in cell wall biosynthesis